MSISTETVIDIIQKLQIGRRCEENTPLKRKLRKSLEEVTSNLMENAGTLHTEMEKFITRRPEIGGKHMQITWFR